MALQVANHTAHESFTADTRDHEDHTFCGMMQWAEFKVQNFGKIND